MSDNVLTSTLTQWTPISKLSETIPLSHTSDLSRLVASRLNELARCDQLTNTMKAIFPAPPTAVVGSSDDTPSSIHKSHRFQALVEKENVSMMTSDKGAQNDRDASWWVRTSAHVLDQGESTELLCANLVLCEQGQYEQCEALKTLGSKPIGNTLLFGSSLDGHPRAFLTPPGVEYAFADPNTASTPHTPAWYAHVFTVAQPASPSSSASLAESLMKECNMGHQRNNILCRRARYELNPVVSPVSSSTSQKGPGAAVVVVELILRSALA